MEKTKEKINKIDAILEQSGAPVLKYFNPGIPPEHLIKLFHEQKIRPDPALIALYEWHNGINFPAEGIIHSVVEIMPMSMFYNLEDMLKTREEMAKWPYVKNASEYLPIFGSSEDDLYLLNNTTGEIFYLSPAATIYGELAFASIDAMLDLIIECYEEKIFTIDHLKGLRCKEDEYFEKLEQYRPI
jgi:hypothetical protein